MKKYKNKCNFYLPISTRSKKLYDLLIPMFNKNADYLVENAHISSVYGAPNCYWNGGRVNFNNVGIEQMTALKNFLESYNIPLRFTFSNTKLLQCHLNDYYCNKLLEIFGNGKHEIIVNSEILESYIRSNYGNKFRYISSTTKVLSNPKEQLDEIKKDYYLIVLDFRYNKNINFLKSIQDKNKCELLINAVCDPNCQNRKKHYDILSLQQINQGVSKDNIECDCMFRTLYESLNLPTFIKAEQIDDYINLGFSHFKIEGRTASNLNLIDTLLYYLVKDEHKMFVRNELNKLI